MRTFGFSTGALVLGDFRAALALVSGKSTNAIELSALRDHELAGLMDAITEMDLGGFDSVSIHAPSRFTTMSEQEVARRLQPCIDLRWHVILHPDAIKDPCCWRPFGELLCLENMDKRKPAGRTTQELAPYVADLPKASLCLDLGHALQVDPTFGVARQILRYYGSRLVQIHLHLSELNAKAQHERISMATVWAVREIAHLLPDVPVILESMVQADQIVGELALARACFETSVPRRTTGAAGQTVHPRG